MHESDEDVCNSYELPPYRYLARSVIIPSGQRRRYHIPLGTTLYSLFPHSPQWVIKRIPKLPDHPTLLLLQSFKPDDIRENCQAAKSRRPYILKSQLRAGNGIIDSRLMFLLMDLYCV